MNNKNEMSILILVLKILAWVGGITTSLIAIFYYLDSGYYGQDLCFETKCVKAFFNIFYSIPEFVDFYLKIVVAVITILGVFYALSNYLNSTTTSRLNVHLLHLNTFKDYVVSEVNKELRLNSKSIDVLKWYNLAFPKSRDGSLKIGEEYISNIKSIINEINSSNDIYQGNKLVEFQYNKHQSNIKLSLLSIGIMIDRMPKKDFFEVENEVFKLINKVNKELCNVSADLIVPMTKYR
ncbi:retron Ec48 family effector membrane protein [Shewanella xiamenensis]|uniref:retron Ec48 family effector membrane protein n=1 Tax=Shewanella xiamenensis TaxID=332186 RepID=UPI000DAFD4F5|nr:retron Ec48 family effector membrane protein [Shewanella xiamenensis]MCT8865088.1 retron Ec48 family effector membrane protein [Shewanella xiamenensis]MCT8878039.1 retron Ec48 family effector membrane protein [Shewanella xiamenensis]PZP29297.1 MAG: hypothetical protein DI594_17350 [Shewanella oneidensis]